MTCPRVLALSVLAFTASIAAASAQTGLVASSCGNDIAKLCSGKEHDGSVRICLEQNYEKVSQGCKKTLDTTGGGRGNRLVGLGKGKSR